MKKNYFKSIWLVAEVFLILACNINVSQVGVPTVTPMVAATFGPTSVVATDIVQTTEPPTQPAPTATGVVLNGTDISFSGTSFTIPTGLATGTINEIIPEANDPNIPFQLYPTYTRITLQGYPLQNKTFAPQVMIYPAKKYAQMSEGAAMLINNLQNIMAAQRTSPAEPIPFLPLENAGQVFHAQEKFLSFKNGNGIRYITQFDQAPLPINNTELFYTFQGLTSDGEYYVSVTMPVNLDYLPADNQRESPTPTNGIPFDWEHFDSFPNYLNQMIDRLNQTDNNFQPALETLDSLVESLLTVEQK